MRDIVSTTNTAPVVTIHPNNITIVSHVRSLSVCVVYESFYANVTEIYVQIKIQPHW